MDAEQRIILGVAAAFLVAVVVFKLRPMPETISTRPDPQTVGASQTPDTADATTAPFYLGFNMPYVWGAPAGLLAPALTDGQVGQTDVNSVENGNAGFVSPDRRWFQT